MTRVEKREYWTERVAAFRDSGLSLLEWCAMNSTSPATLQYWIRKSAVAVVAPSHSWMPVAVIDRETPSANLAIKVGNLTIEVHQDTDMTLLCDVVRALQSVC